ncbi:MAG: thiosulfate oxidation carrier protein SoxY [Burkholderiales bacterium]|nr:thiosulfate oxidation carrier protein SoxY [Burkholderiales bacterium]
MPSRRELLAASLPSLHLAGMLAGLGLLPGQALAADAPGWNASAFDAKSVADVMKALGVAAPTPSTGVVLSAPEIAENGAVVPVGVSSSLPGVTRLMVLVEKNPATLSALFEIGDAVEPTISTRVKMGQTSNVYAVALTKDGALHYAVKEVKVTLGGCGG